MTPEQREARIAQLREKLRARRNKAGTAENIVELEAAIERLEAGEDE